jgi:NADH:ubiquinone oxidoreductase subunit E
MEKTLEKIIKRYKETDGNVIFLLQETQDAFGYIPREAVDYFSSELNIPGSRFYGVVTFYSQFRLKPVGKNKIVACCGTACHVRGSEKIINNLKRELALSEGEDTTPDGEFTLETVNCVGACSIAPVFLINRKVHAKGTIGGLLKEIEALSDGENEKS